jgi:hypothetical protein
MLQLACHKNLLLNYSVFYGMVATLTQYDGVRCRKKDAIGVNLDTMVYMLKVVKGSWTDP